MKVLLDHDVPWPPVRFFSRHDVLLADELGLARLKNGELLDAAEAAGFDVLLSGDKTMRYEQNMAGRNIALIYLSDNHWPIIQQHIEAIVSSMEAVNPW